MKKLKYLLLILSLILITSCGNNNDDDTCKHSKSDWIIDIEATCTSEGLKHIECTKCNEVIKTETINKTNHDLVHHEKFNPTCTTPGYEEYDTCKNCSYTTYKVVEALGHNYVNDECTRCHNKEEESNLVYKLNKTGYWVTGIKEETTKIIVPSTYNNIPVIGIEKNTFNNCNIVEEIEIKDNVIYILDDFSGCSNLKKLSLPSCLNLNIYNRSLEEIVFTSGIIIDEVYIEAYNLEKIILADELRSIEYIDIDCSNNIYNKYDKGYYLGTNNNPYYALIKYEITHQVKIHNKVKIVQSGVFYRGNFDFTEIYFDGTIEDWCNIVLPDSIFSQEDFLTTNYLNRFYMKDETGQYKEVTEIVIPDTVTSIGEYQFCNFTNINKISIPNSVTSIGYRAFWHCRSLTSIEIPDSVISIGSSAFYNCKSLTSIEIPSSVISIGSSAFEYCNSLDSVYYEGTIEDWCNIKFDFEDSFVLRPSSPMVSANHFYLKNSNGEYKEVTEIEIPDTVTAVGDDQFYGFSNVIKITIPNSVTSIGSGAFTGCSSLTSIEIPTSIKIMGRNSFENVYYNGTIEDWCKIIFSFLSDYEYDNNYENIYMKNSNGEYEEVTEIVLSDNITKLGNHQFAGFNKVTKITIPNSVTSIGANAFMDCSSLTSIEIPLSVTSIGQYSFIGCSSLDSVYYEGTIEDWCNITFNNYDSNPMSYANHFYIKNSNGEYVEVTEIEIPDTITKIGSYQFYGFNNITKITIPNSVTSIGHYAFYNCRRLTSITIPNSVTSIGASAFSGCSSLTIYCEVSSQPKGWVSSSYYSWNPSNCPVIWNYKNID